jgi:hypothetical protein
MTILLSSDGASASGFLVTLRADGWHVSCGVHNLGVFNSRGTATEEACVRAARTARAGCASVVVVPGEIRELHSFAPSETQILPANDDSHASAKQRT